MHGGSRDGELRCGFGPARSLGLAPLDSHDVIGMGRYAAGMG